jgi:acyl-CoA dehydrogenase
MLDDTLQRLLTARLGDAQARGEPGLADALAADFVEAGLHLVMQPEETGGMGGTIADAAAVAWRCGWHAAPLPVTEMLLLPTIDAEASVLATSIAHGNPASAPVLRSTTSVLVPGRAIAVAQGTLGTPLSQAARVRLDGVGANWDDTVLMRGALLTAAAMTGAMARVLEIATDYVDTRVQFGRP